MVLGMALGKREMLVMAMAYMLLAVSAGARHGKVGELGEEAEADRIIELPGQPKVSFQQYSGYVTVNDTAGRALFYWLTEAVHQPESKPLVFWFNGGPGCSSLAYGASEEVGPFRIKKNGTGLYLNKNSWNTQANVIFLESPAGVGFSYTNTSSDLYTTGDTQTAKEALEFVIRWLNRFPHYKKHDIYLSGESYAGHYVPQLAKNILTHNSKSEQPINLKGILVGNAVMDYYYDNVGTVDYYWTHALISDETHKEMLSKCDYHNKTVTPECKAITDYVENNMTGGIDMYSIYTPPCNDSDGSPRTRRFPLQSISSSTLRRRRRRLSGYDPCTDHYAKIYYNRPDVQKAFHANTTNISYSWTTCSDSLFDNWTDSAFSVLPIYKDMIAAGLRIWVYSGDADAVVPVTATKYSLAQLKLKTKIPWYPWYVKETEVGGWTEVYEGLTFATVRGAGHEVPVLKPKASLQLLKSFLSGTPLPK
ncbi:serine carboxypeptidase-like 25 [Macadamia integrifolia]|uniref:serine carboxypeptidase-like 25 n=1 Tax=Macadamia integrifolia TaxID=60698 RepID=UPI001C4F9149|nr:serine carboxypeptidase-like 25 [Macadamia integrifolia]